VETTVVQHSPGDDEGRVLPLSGRTVLDFGTALAGPVCATLLAEFGADVIKIERPGQGDTLRTYGPRIDGVPAWWMVEGRNKRSVTLDLRRPAGQRLARDLAARADVLVENFRPGTMDGWGLGYDDLCEANPRLVYVSVSGFGQQGPYRDRPAYDRVAQGMSGFTYLNGFPDRPPVRPGVGVTDYSTAVFAALGAMLALYERDAQGSGAGQRVDVALYESQLRMFHYYLPVYERLGLIPERSGNFNPAMVPAESFLSRDGSWITLAVGTERNFVALVEAMGQPELAGDPRFAGNEQRTVHHEEIHALVRQWVAEHPAAHVLDVLRAAGVPAGPIYTVADVHGDAHFRERGSVTTMRDPTLGEVSVQGVVPALSATPGVLRSTGPALGAHNEEIYRGLLGLSAEELAGLVADGVV
jgi:crotonobetainyl-CoA:carnitine CoA-transferase CaiB-like acyl-CoA transferase